MIRWVKFQFLLAHFAQDDDFLCRVQCKQPLLRRSENESETMLQCFNVLVETSDAAQFQCLSGFLHFHSTKVVIMFTSFFYECYDLLRLSINQQYFINLPAVVRKMMFFMDAK
jgi:hypothetical protein